ncbi:MAG: YHS domain-containing protein [Fimbriimonas sp.]
MKKLMFVAAALLAVSGAALAKGDKKIACAVMTSSKVEIAKATKDKMFSDYKGRRYFFCCAGCPEAFKKDPAKYAKSPSIPTPKTK